MTPRKAGTSPHTRYRRARKQLADLEALQATLARSRPRTPGKKGAKTRALNTLARRIPAMRGSVTKARNAVAKAASERVAAKSAAKRKRSEATKKAWATRRARKSVPAPIPASSGLFMPFLTKGGVVYVNPVGTDRKLVGGYWHAVRVYLDSGTTNDLDRFDGRAIFDTETQRRLPFITDPDSILEHVDEIDFGASFYKRRDEVVRFAA